MKNVFVIVLMFLFAGVANAQFAPPGNPNFCVNNPGHPHCAPGNGGGDNGDGGTGGNLDVDNNSYAVGIGVGVGVGVASSEANANANSNATAGAVATGGNANAVGIGGNANATGGAGGNANAVGIGGTGGSSNANIGDVVATVGDVTNTNTVTATGGEGGAGGTAVAAAVVETGAVQVAEGAVSNTVSYEYRQVRQAPSIGQGSFAISGCGVAGNAGGSNSSGAAFLGFGWTPAQCYDFMLAQAYQSVGETKTACEVLNNSKAGKRAARRGVELPDCEPEYVIVEVPVPQEIDLSPYATKEALERAFIRSQQSK